MFNRIPPDEFGWLLIDEAGQALPQAAVGALMRCKRAVVVGDPLQIEPVVVLPDQLTEALCKEFKVDESRFNAPKASAQTLADSATSYFSTFETKMGLRGLVWVPKWGFIEVQPYNPSVSTFWRKQETCSVSGAG